jgi:hypothetical protein
LRRLPAGSILARTDHCENALRMCKFDTKHAFKTGIVNEGEAQESDFG